MKVQVHTFSKQEQSAADTLKESTWVITFLQEFYAVLD